MQKKYIEKLNFTGRVALVTGASKGIGREIVMGLAGQGASVLFTYRTADDSVETLEAWGRENGFQIRGLVCDHAKLSDYDGLKSEIDQIGELDVLVNNVGDVLRRSSFEESDDDLWIDTMNVNVLSSVRVSRLALPFLFKSEHAAIVNVSSIAGSSGGSGDSLHYAASKGAMDVFTKGLAKEITKKGVRVNGVAPSAIDTDFQTKHSSEERMARIIAGTPMGRIGSAEEVADVVVYLASDAASYISGQTIIIAGGR